MAVPFDPGYTAEPYLTLCRDHPGTAVYPTHDFRTEWGPIFHRGRLDGSARVLVLGQDPAAHETIVRRILVGKAGQRVQGFLAKLGVDSSYVMINTFLYSVFRNSAVARYRTDSQVAAYRNRWLSALLTGPHSRVEAVVTLGTAAHAAFRHWRATPEGQPYAGAYEHLIHPTFPESAAGDDPTRCQQLTEQMLANWNAALQRLRGALQHPDTTRPLALYGGGFAEGDLVPIPQADLPAGLPAWMTSLDEWAARVVVDGQPKRFVVAVTVPEGAR